MAEIEKSIKKRKRRQRPAIYGNYTAYYGYRINNKLGEDPRLKMLKKEWFEGRDCLDIGCNVGLITISIAKKFSCRSILGIDIDARLVDSANVNLRNEARNDVRSQSMTSLESDNSKHVETLEPSISSGTVNFVKELSTLNKGNLLERVGFRTENFVERLDACSEEYDTIICLSVTKWIHLNWGDDGLITLFAKIWKLLRPGGILVLEPQPWKSYKSCHQVSETASHHFKNILFTPGIFPEILLDKIGFRTMEKLTDSLQGSAAGFDRPIFAFSK